MLYVYVCTVCMYVCMLKVGMCTLMYVKYMYVCAPLTASYAVKYLRIDIFGLTTAVLESRFRRQLPIQSGVQKLNVRRGNYS